MIDHLVDQLRGFEEFAFERTSIDFEGHRLAEIAFGDGPDRARHFGCGPYQVIDQRVDGSDFISPTAARIGDSHPLFELAFLSHGPGHARRFAQPALADRDEVVEGVGDLAFEARQIRRQPGRKVSVSEREYCREKLIDKGAFPIRSDARGGRYRRTGFNDRRFSVSAAHFGYFPYSIHPTIY